MLPGLHLPEHEQHLLDLVQVQLRQRQHRQSGLGALGACPTVLTGSERQQQHRQQQRLEQWRKLGDEHGASRSTSRPLLIAVRPPTTPTRHVARVVARADRGRTTRPPTNRVRRARASISADGLQPTRTTRTVVCPRLPRGADSRADNSGTLSGNSVKDNTVTVGSGTIGGGGDFPSCTIENPC